MKEETEGRRQRVSLEGPVLSRKMQEFSAYLPPLCSVMGKMPPLPPHSSIKCLLFGSGERSFPLNIMFHEFTLSLSVRHFRWWLCTVKKKRIQ